MSPFIVRTFEERQILEIAARYGCKAEVVRDGRQLVSDEELGTRVIVSGGEVTEVDKQSNNEMEL